MYINNVYLSPKDKRRFTVFTKHVGRGINKFNMIENGETILIAISGGKDSLALTAALSERMRWVPIKYSLVAMQIEWREFPLRDEEREAIDRYFAGLKIPLYRVRAKIFPDNYDKGFNCYICSRNRKRIIFKEAERFGIKKIALGHHLDDIVETTLINLFFRGEFSTMMPVQDFFNGKMKIIRPMCEVREKEIERIATMLRLPVVPVRCPKMGVNERNFIKRIIKEIEQRNKRVKENIYQAPWNIKENYLPLYLNQD